MIQASLEEEPSFNQMSTGSFESLLEAINVQQASFRDSNIGLLDDVEIEISEIEIYDTKNPETKLAYKSWTNFWIGILVIACMVIPLSMVGPLTISLPSNSALVSCTWRTQGWALLGIPITLSIYVYNGSKMNFWQDHSPRMLLRSAMTALFFFGWYLGLIVGCSLTLTSHADIMYSSTGVYVLILSLVTCKVVHKLEILGYMFFGVGVIIMITDPYATKLGEEHSYMGDLIPFLGAGLGAIFGLLNQHNLKWIHPFVLATHWFCFSACYQLLIIPYLEDNVYFYTTHPEYGAFGWLSKFDTFIYVEVFLVPLTGVVGNLALFTSYMYWPMEILSIVILIEPFIAQITGIVLGQDTIPGIRTIAGMIIITFGLVVASYGARFKAINQLKEFYNKLQSENSYEMAHFARHKKLDQAMSLSKELSLAV